VIFSDAWGVPGSMRKLLMILLNGRQTYVYFSEPLPLRRALEAGRDSAFAAHKAARALRMYFRRLQTSLIGPDLSHRRTLIRGLLRAAPVQQAIDQHSAARGVPRDVAAREAERMAREIAADYSHIVVRALEILLSWVWTRIYRGIRIYHLERVAPLVREHEVVYVPCHRSHIDYLLLSYLLVKNGLFPPHIAAGDNLNLPLLGPILRRGGAFFLRRSFRGDKLYTAVFSEYLHTMMKRGFSIEYFVEGGRSRTGRTLSPRSGMLAMSVRGHLRGSRRRLAFVPVYVGYEKVLESGSYMSEMLGKAKRKESLGGFFRTLGRLRDSYGEVHVNFGEPILLDELLDRCIDGWRDAARAGREPTGLPEAIDRLAVEVVTRINSAAVVNPVNLVAVALLATRKHVMDESSLHLQLRFYVEMLRALPYHSDTVLSEEDPARIVEHALGLDMLSRHAHPLGDLIYASDASALMLAYFRNNVLHLFALPSLVASFFTHNRGLTPASAQELAALMYPALRGEFFLRWSEEELAAHVEATLQLLIARGMLVWTARADELCAAPAESAEYPMLLTLAQAIAPTIARYYITVRLLEAHDSGTLDTTQLEELAYLAADRLSWLQEFRSPEFSDRKVIRGFIDGLVDRGYLERNAEQKLCFDERLRRADEEARRLLASDIRHGIIQITSRVGAGEPPAA